MSDNPLATLAMRERAAEELDSDVADLKADASRFRPGSDPYHGRMAFAEAANRQAERIRALPTTFTDAELLDAAMQFPEVRALVEALKMASIWLNYDGRYDMQGINAALTPFMKGAS